jgi:hypothetical protein
MKPSQQKMLSEAFIPNSVAYRKSNLEKAEEMLIIAKAIPRKVRRAKPNECEFWRELQRVKNSEPPKLKLREDGLVSAKDAKTFFGISMFTIQEQRKKGTLPFKKEKAKYYYDPEDLKKIEVRKYRKTE